jgi:hypothetical protein
MIAITAKSAQVETTKTFVYDDAVPCIRKAQSCAPDARDAVREFYAAVVQPDLALVIFFCSSEYDLEVLGEEMRRLFAGVQVVGCTTAGEIGPAGYLDCSITGASFPARSLSAVSGRIDRLQHFECGFQRRRPPIAI